VPSVVHIPVVTLNAEQFVSLVDIKSLHYLSLQVFVYIHKPSVPAFEQLVDVKYDVHLPISMHFEPSEIHLEL
jgi:hypothetical protein